MYSCSFLCVGKNKVYYSYSFIIESISSMTQHTLKIDTNYWFGKKHLLRNKYSSKKTKHDISCLKIFQSIYFIMEWSNLNIKYILYLFLSYNVLNSVMHLGHQTKLQIYSSTRKASVCSLFRKVSSEN